MSSRKKASHIFISIMTDSMNFGPDWIRNLSSEGTTTGGVSGGARCQLADYRYGREEMLSFFDKNLKPPQSLLGFKGLYSEVTLPPLALSPVTDEERVWTTRPISLNGPPRGRGIPMERGGRVSRGGRGGYQNYGRPSSYDGNWGSGGEQTEWSPRKEYNSRSNNDNWRRNRLNEDDEGWRNLSHNKPVHEKWVRSSWRSGDGEPEDRGERQIGGPESRGNQIGWSDGSRGNAGRKSWDTEDHLPEWVMENVDGGGTFDSSGAFHHSDEEQGDLKPTVKKEAVLQKSSSQQHITTSKGYFSSLQTSKSVASLSKPDTNYNMKEKSYDSKKTEEENQETESTDRIKHTQQKIRSELDHKERERKETPLQKPPEHEGTTKKAEPAANSNTVNHKDTRVEDDYKIQEDIILKLVDEDNAPKAGLGVVNAENVPTVTPTTLQPPPNLGPPMQDHWFYQDPQGQMQGPFSSAEMAEWYKAGYFNNQLKVRRPCDELFYLLGELVALCEGANPFQVVASRFPPLKPDPATLAEHDLLQYQYLMALKQTRVAAAMPEPWSTLTLQQQQEIAAQRLIMHPQVSQELPFIHQSNSSNPLMQMINQMQQANKLPSASISDATPSALPGQLDPRLVTLSLQHQLQQQQSRLPPTSAGMLPNPLASRLPGVTTDGLNLPGMLQRPIGIPTPSIGASALANAMNMQRPLHAPVVENMVPKVTDDPIRSLLNQLQQKPSGISLDLWQSSQFPIPTTLPSQQWQHETPLSMWDITKPPEIPPQQPELPPTVLTSQQIENALIPKPPSHEQEHQPHLLQQKLTEKKAEPSISPKELRKKKELEEKQAKKEAEERRKNEQRKLEAEKREAEEKKKKEVERIKKEIEKAKKEAEEKRMKELEEKRRLKEQRKAEEEAKRMTEEQKKAEEEKAKKEAREREEYARREAARQAQEQAARNAKTAPWCQSSSTQGLTLQEIQKLEKEKAKQEAVIQQQQKQMMEFQQQQLEKSAAGFSWANKAKEPKQVKSLSEIQAEEQERMTKQATEARLLALQKEKELPTPVQNTGNIWSSQNISWSANGVNSSQWSSSNSTGLWEETPAKTTINKPSINSKSNTVASGKSQPQNSQQQQQQSQKPKTKTKKEESNISKSSPVDDFTNWCSKALANITSEIDIPTFVTFLRDIESALDVREYCKEYLGDNAEALQFASNFLDKRRSFRPKSQAPKDDMCSPAPAITPSSIHSNDFQEVKGKNKKNKKNKMLKVDSRILGFNVTSAPDRINVGDRDYGDNS